MKITFHPEKIRIAHLTDPAELADQAKGLLGQTVNLATPAEHERTLLLVLDLVTQDATKGRQQHWPAVPRSAV